MRRCDKAIIVVALWCFCTAEAKPPAAASLMSSWRARVAEAVAKPVPQLSTAIAGELYRRVVIDRAARTAFSELTADLPAAEKEAVKKALWVEIGAIDADNSAYVETILPETRWFDDRRDGKGVSAWAWVIVQHSPNWQLKRDTLVRLAPLVENGREPGSRYALLYDRLAQHDGRPQRFGSQLICRDGRLRPSAIEDEANVDARRAKMGLEPLAEYLKGFGDRC